MTAASYMNGHAIGVLKDRWVYLDNNEPTLSNPRACGKCSKWPVNDHDACIVNLPGVKNACCGHGTDQGYVQFESGLIIRGNFEIEGVGNA